MKIWFVNRNYHDMSGLQHRVFIRNLLVVPKVYTCTDLGGPINCWWWWIFCVNLICQTTLRGFTFSLFCPCQLQQDSCMCMYAVKPCFKGKYNVKLWYSDDCMHSENILLPKCCEGELGETFLKRRKAIAQIRNFGREKCPRSFSGSSDNFLLVSKIRCQKDIFLGIGRNLPIWLV